MVGIEDEIREFVVGQLDWDGPREQLSDEYPLIENGVLDSMGIFHLVGMIEDRYGIEVADEELLPDNFETLAAIARLVGSKLAS